MLYDKNFLKLILPISHTCLNADPRSSDGVSVILTQDKEGVGSLGEEISVKAGFARNYLVPQKIAVYATDFNKMKYKDILESLRREEESSEIDERFDFSEIISNIQNEAYNVKKEANSEGTLYGSIRKSEILDMIENKMPSSDFIGLTDQSISFTNDATAITSTGQHEVHIKLSDDASATITINVEVSSS